MSSDDTTLPNKLNDCDARFHNGNLGSPLFARNGVTTTPFHKLKMVIEKTAKGPGGITSMLLT